MRNSAIAGRTSTLPERRPAYDGRGFHGEDADHPEGRHRRRRRPGGHTAPPVTGQDRVSDTGTIEVLSGDLQPDPAISSEARSSNRLQVALGLAAMVILPLIVFLLIPAGLANMAHRSSGPPAPGPAQPRFGPVLIEAESPTNRLTGYAWAGDYPGASGGRIVQGLGTYGSPHRPGTLVVTVSVPATGRYLLTFFYTQVDGERARSVEITVNGTAREVVPVAGTGACCTTKTVSVTLRTGSNSITFANPDGRAPAIDRMEIRSP